MANVVTVRIKTKPAVEAIKAYATSAALTMTGSGSDNWETVTSGVTLARSFSVTVEFSGGES